MSDKKFNIAILIDGDNAQAKLLKEVIEEVSKYGKATIRRIYGDWTSNSMNSWKDSLNLHSISPIQKFAYTKGKNSTDSSMIIDAMDILHGKNIDGFCIVSSDSDYTGLAKRIREAGLFVMGIGVKQTPEAFVKSCEIFTFTENLIPQKSDVTINESFISKPTERSELIKTRKGKKSKIEPMKSTETTSLLTIEDEKTINKAFEISVNVDDTAFISKIGGNIRKIDPSFDPRTYGFSSLSKLFENLPQFEVIKNEVGGLNHPILKKRM